jgi:hypothetical protein
MSQLIPKNIIIVDPITGEPANVETNGGLAVNIQDQHSRAFDLHFAQAAGSPTTLSADTVVDSYSISCTTGHGLVAGDNFSMFDPTIERGHTAQVLSIAGDNTVNMDRPVADVFTSAATVVQEQIYNMSVDGSVTRQTFSIGSAALVSELDIVRLMFQMTTVTAVDWTGFGDLAALTRGVMFRQTFDATASNNHWNVKTTSELAHLMFDLAIYDTSASPQGINGIAGRLTYGSPGKHGVTLRIGAGDFLEIIIQDNLEGLTYFGVMAQGHFVTD